jgi:hypothetical protein
VKLHTVWRKKSSRGSKRRLRNSVNSLSIRGYPEEGYGPSPKALKLIELRSNLKIMGRK